MSPVTRESLLIPPLEGAPRDEALFQRLVEASGDLEVYYEALDPAEDLAGAIKDHLTDPTTQDQPLTLERGQYVRPDSERFADSEARLREFKEEIRERLKTTEDPEERDILQLYRWKVNEYIASARMVQTINEKPRAFDLYNKFIHGNPDPEVFAAVCDEFRAGAEEMLESEHEVVRDAAKRVLMVVPDLGGNREHLEPDEATFQAVRESHYAEGGFYALLLAGAEVPEKGPIKPEVGEPILEQVRRNIGAEHYKRVPSEGKSWSVTHGDPQVKGPMEYSMPLKRFIGLPVAHEEGTHILENRNGMRQPLRILSLGVDRTVLGNEGRAVTREQVPYESFADFAKLVRWQDILRRHFVTGMMAGLHNGDTSLDTIVRTLQAVDQLREMSTVLKDPQKATPENLEVATNKALGRTVSLVARVWARGINKDMAYLEGNINAWDNPDLIDEGDEGKWDIANRRHRRFLVALGILTAR